MSSVFVRMYILTDRCCCCRYNDNKRQPLTMTESNCMHCDISSLSGCVYIFQTDAIVFYSNDDGADDSMMILINGANRLIDINFNFFN